jgi:hypothetical protein
MLNAGEVKTIYIIYHLGQNNAVSPSYCIIYEKVDNGLVFLMITAGGMHSFQ